jgi:hypothetical protein
MADFNYWTHNNSLGLKDNVAFIGFPHSSVEDPHLSCGGVDCSVHGTTHKPGNFRGLHLPIWDGGAHGTAVNDSNIYAKYVFDIVTTYKDYVRFWEIWNEPDFSTSANAWAGPANPNSWWNRSNFECDCPCMAGTIFDYVRMLRVSYEVIKTVDSTAYVCTGGIGWPSFLDAILRYTDNPVDGSVTAAYPLTGGAYFDVLSFHIYPQFSEKVRYWSNALGRMVDERHSDAAADGVRSKKQSLNAVLQARGYNGSTYPEKEWIITEHNISRRAFNNYVGGEEAQRNYHIKSLVFQQMDDIRQSYVFGLSEQRNLAAASGSYDLMGLYESLSFQPLTRPLTGAGIANLTLDTLLSGTQYDEAETQRLNLPANVRGAAFADANGEHTYVLWAKTGTDYSEQASASYSFPASVVSTALTRYAWDYGQTYVSSSVSSMNLALTGAPIFLREQTILPLSLLSFAATRTEEYIDLRWEVASEYALDEYRIARSTNGQDFEAIAWVSAKNRTTVTRYASKDFQVDPGPVWYQLSAHDLDGHTTILKRVLVNQASEALSMDAHWENPGQVKLRLSLPEAQPGNLQLLSSEGRIIRDIYLSPQAGFQEIAMDMSAMSSGLYLLLLKSGEQSLSSKIIHSNER